MIKCRARLPLFRFVPGPNFVSEFPRAARIFFSTSSNLQEKGEEGICRFLLWIKRESFLVFMLEEIFVEESRNPPKCKYTHSPSFFFALKTKKKSLCFFLLFANLDSALVFKGAHFYISLLLLLARW